MNKKFTINNIVIICLYFILSGLCAAPGFAGDEDTKISTTKDGDTLLISSLIPDLEARIDLKPIQSDGNYGFDYHLGYKIHENNKSQLKYDISLLSDGYITNKREIGTNSIISQLKSSLRFFSIPNRELTNEEKTRFATLLSKNALEFTQLEQVEYLQLSQLNVNRSYVVLDAHGKIESDQRFEDNQGAFGVNAAFDLDMISYATSVLDFPFKLFRSKQNLIMPGSPRILIGYDYVNTSNIESRKKLTNDDAYSRITAQAAWKTYILDAAAFKVLWQGYYEINAPKTIKDANMDLTSFVELTLAFPTRILNKVISIQKFNQTIFIKYADGKLPPTLTSTSQVSTGFSFDF